MSSLKYVNSLLCIKYFRIEILLAMTAAVRHCMEYRFQKFDSSKPPSTLSTAKGALKEPLESILELTDLMNDSEFSNDYDYDNEDVAQLIASFVKNPESVLQELDIQRLRAIIYRDVVRPDRSKTNKNVVAIVVNQASFFVLYCFTCSNCCAYFCMENLIVCFFGFRMTQNNHNFYH